MLLILATLSQDKTDECDEIRFKLSDAAAAIDGPRQPDHDALAAGPASAKLSEQSAWRLASGARADGGEAAGTFAG
ncbi:MAG: hypothetical protein WDN30_05560 [Pararobbsia sp.]